MECMDPLDGSKQHRRYKTLACGLMDLMKEASARWIRLSVQSVKSSFQPMNGLHTLEDWTIFQVNGQHTKCCWQLLHIAYMVCVTVYSYQKAFFTVQVHSKKKICFKALFWCFSFSQIGDSCQCLEGP